MDSKLYISLVQDRLFLALAGLLGALVLDAVRGVLFRHHADPRPSLERLADMLFYPLARRLNREGRAGPTLFMRGLFVLALGCVVYLGAGALLYMLAREHGQGAAFSALLVAFSTGTVGWFAPMKALASATGDAKAPRPYFVLARATYTNLVPLDDHGLIRVAATGALRSLTVRLAAPLVLYVLGGWEVLAIYWPVMALAFSTGRDGTDHGFGVVADALATLLLIVPTLLFFPVALLALFFSGGASFFRALPALLHVRRWPPLLQGGAPLMLAAYAMRLMLGGPRQDRAGAPVPAGWIGPEGGTARLSTNDIGRVLYYTVVALFLTAVALYGLSVVFAGAG